MGYRSAPAFVDVDNDGDDPVIGRGGGDLKFYYENTGTRAILYELEGVLNRLTEAMCGIECPCFVDVDNDGDMDL